ncbi:hypothetical protein DITRI_Ditri09bG0044400 [Diplodiscus trichospermus]
MAEPLVDLGSRLAQTPYDLVAKSDVVFSIFGYLSDIRHHLFLELLLNRCPPLDSKLANQIMIASTMMDFDLGFIVNHFVKDFWICLNKSENMGLALPGLALAQQLYLLLKAHAEGNL